jgi:predicted ATP-grasp superfamily ATP-dependent carboligase
MQRSSHQVDILFPECVSRNSTLDIEAPVLTDNQQLVQDAPAVVLGAGINGLGQVRALGQAGIRTFCVAPLDADKFGACSCYATHILSPDPFKQPEQVIDLLGTLSSQQECKPMLLFAGDEWLRLCANFEAALRDSYIIPQSPWTLLGDILNKQTLYGLAQKCDIPQPSTCPFSSLREIPDQANSLPFPSVLKLEINSIAQLPEGLRPTLKHRVTRYESAAQLLAWLQIAFAYGFDSPALFQDFIPGGAESLYTLTSYTNRHGQLLAGAVGHKVRQYPPQAGGITVGRIAHVEAVFVQGKRLLEGIGFHGLANTEFKFDKRDGSYRLMEINPRLGLWNGSVLHAGINLPEIAYADMQGKDYNGVAYTQRADGTIWLDALGDAQNCLWDYSAAGYTGYDMTPLQWLRSIRGAKVDAVWRWHDPLPWLSYLSSTFLRRFKGLLRKILR